MNESPHNGLHTKRKLNNDDKSVMIPFMIYSQINLSL